MQSAAQEGGRGLMMPCGCHSRLRVLFAVALMTSLLWYLFWVVMDPVEPDIRGLINWYFFVRFNLRSIYDVYGTLGFIHKWCPLAILVMFVLSWAGMPGKSFFSKLSQVVYTTIISYNALLFVYLLVAGRKVSTLFLVTLPLQVVFVLNRFLIFVLLLPTLGLALYYILRIFQFDSSSKKNPRLKYCLFKAALLRGLAIVLLYLGIVAATRTLTEWGCQPCPSHELPRKPLLVAHRGCGYNFPENTVLAFEESAKDPQIEALETDVQISYDGVPFLLHDPHLIRTTNIVQACPSLDPLMNATWLNFSSGDCPLRDLNTGAWFTKEVASNKRNQFKDQKLITLAEFLRIAKHAGKSVIFDLWQPPPTHPYFSSYINVTLDAIISSGINQTKVWWLLKEGRQGVRGRFPGMMQITKTEETDFEEFKKEHIQLVNDDWTAPLSTTRKYQAANLSVNMFVVESSFLLDYAWCVGVQTVTTDNCWQFSRIQQNNLYQVCEELRATVNRLLVPLTITLLLCSLSCMTCFECLQKQKLLTN